MDLVHDRTSINAEKDRISNLPTEIIHHILSLLDMKCAIQTCKLSRRWRHIWTSMPHLNLDYQKFRNLPQFANFVKHALSRRNNQTEVSTAKFNMTGKPTQFVVKSIINYAYLHNVKQLTVTWVTWKFIEFPQCLFSSQTLKYLTIATPLRAGRPCAKLPKLSWDFPALETLNLQNLQVGDSNFFSKCVNLKDLTLHRCCMYSQDIFNVCAPQLSNLTITDPFAFPKVFNVVAPRLKNLTSSISIVSYMILSCYIGYSEKVDFLQLSTEGLDSLEKVNLFFSPTKYKEKIDVPRLLNLFQELRSVKFLVLNDDIIENLSSCLDQLAHEPSPFYNLKSLKINALPLKQKELIESMPSQVRNYFFESSPGATFVMDLPQVPKKRPTQPDTKAEKVAKLAEQKRKAATMVEEKRTLEIKLQMVDEVIANQKVMQETLKSQHEHLMSQIIKCKMTELHVEIEGGNPSYGFIHSIGCDIKSIFDSTPESLRVAMETQFYHQYEEVKDLLLTHIDASQWAKVETELGLHKQSGRIHSNSIHSQSDVDVAFSSAP